MDIHDLRVTGRLAAQSELRGRGGGAAPAFEPISDPLPDPAAAKRAIDKNEGLAHRLGASSGEHAARPGSAHTSHRGGAKNLAELCSPSLGAQLELLSLWVGAYLPAHLKRTAEVRAQKAAGRTSRRMSSLSYKVELAGVLVP